MKKLTTVFSFNLGQNSDFFRVAQTSIAQKFFLFLCLITGTFSVLGQSITGKITDAETVKPLNSANIILVGTARGTQSNSQGDFTLKNLAKGKYTLKITYVGYENFTQVVDLQKDERINVILKKSIFVADEVVVNATRANEKSGVAYTNVLKEDIQKQNLGQDIPQLLNFTPSLVTTSDAGAGIGYTGLRIRGTDATRINVTINGIPYNESESQGTYWVNMPDFASSVSSIQIQRGVGTSTNGAGAFGASVNVSTNEFHKDAYGQINASVGSFKTLKTTFMAGTGLIADKFTFDARLSRITSDGYIDRSASNLKSFYLSGAYFGKKSFIRLNVFSGAEKTYQAWEGVPEALLATNRTFNLYTYPNQTDNYQQDHYQLLSSHTLSNELTLNVNFHYTYGRGYYEQLREEDKYSKYGLPNVTVGTVVQKKTDFIRRKWLDNDFYGTTFSLDYKGSGRLSGNVGGGQNTYDGRHFGEIIWAKNPSTSTLGYRWYENKALKTDFNIYAKANYQFSDNINGFVDLQYRGIGYDMKGIADKRQDITQNNSYNFFNPKFGITTKLSETSRAFASYSVGNKEPSRQDFENNIQKAPQAETLRDLEIGYQSQSKGFAFALNGYYMDYKNQLVLTGKLNDVGEAIRINVPKSYRMGIELEAGVQATKSLKINANATFSENKILNFVEEVPNYDGGANVENKFTKTDIAFSPNVIFGSQILYSPVKNLEIGLLSKYVGKQYLDNTTNAKRQLNAYFTNDLRLNYFVETKTFKKIGFNFLVNNIFNSLYESNGYTYSYISDGQTITENFYYPQAGTNFLLGVNLTF